MKGVRYKTVIKDGMNECHKNHLHSNNGICGAVVGEFYIRAHKNGVKKMEGKIKERKYMATW